MAQCFVYFNILVSDYDRLDEDLAERMSAIKTAGETDMDFYERRYKERVSSALAKEKSLW